MSTQTTTIDDAREPVLSPVDRISEILFGLLMALSFVGAVSVAETGRAEIREMFIAALGCNLAWGLVDAVMYLVRTVADNGRRLTLVNSVRAAADAQTGRSLIEQALSRSTAGLVSETEIEAIRQRMLDRPVVAARPTLGWNDLRAALAIFLLVVLATFPVVLPFAFMQDVGAAKSLSHAIALGMLFVGGLAFGRYGGRRRLEGRLHDGGTGLRARDRHQGAGRMNAAGWALAVLVATMAASASGAEEGSGHHAAAADKAAWEFGITAYPTVVRGGGDYTSGIVVADRGPLHLEARINYEAVGARSAFVGWTFSGGEEVEWELTPMLGAVWGATEAFAPGLEASVSWKRLDFYVEAEYVRDRNEQSGSYFYAWSELGFRPVEWLRLGLAAQRTRAYGGDRDIQRGPFAQVTWQRLTLGAFWFNPGSGDQVVVTSIGMAF